MKLCSILAFDIDGTLTEKNKTEISPKRLVILLDFLDQLGHFSILVIGKPAAYANRIIISNNIKNRGIIAENAGVYQIPNSKKIKVYGESLEEMNQLKRFLNIESEKGGVTKIYLNNKSFEVVVDPEDISILTIFTDPSFVSHRWDFIKTIDAEDLYRELNRIIKINNWQKNLEVLEPFSDGAVQVIRKDSFNNEAIDKSSLTAVLKKMYFLNNNLPIAMFGDGHNDIPAMRSKQVIPITFKNADNLVREFVLNREGYISKQPAALGLGIVESIDWLAKDEKFFGDDSVDIRNKINEIFPSLS